MWERCLFGRIPDEHLLRRTLHIDTFDESFGRGFYCLYFTHVGHPCTIPRDTEVYADRNMLITIFRNLLGNAIKFSYSGSIVELSVNQDHDEYNEFIVADTGG